MKTIKYGYTTPFPSPISPMSKHSPPNIMSFLCNQLSPVSAAYVYTDVGTSPGAQEAYQQSPPKEYRFPSLSNFSLSRAPHYNVVPRDDLPHLCLNVCHQRHAELVTALQIRHKCSALNATPILTTLQPRIRGHHRTGGGKIVKAKGWGRMLGNSAPKHGLLLQS